MKKGTRTLAAAGAATAVLAFGTAAGIGIAAADPPPSPSPTPSAACGTQHQHGRARGVFRHTEHGQLTLSGKKHRVIDVQRGTVSSVSPNNIKITSKDGFAAGYVITSKTVVREWSKGKKPVASPASAIKTGDRVRLIGTKSGNTITANRIAFRS